MKIKYVLLLGFTFTILSCKKTTTNHFEEENTYQIINLLTNDTNNFLVTPPVFSIPPMPDAKNHNGKIMTCQDSVKGYRYYFKQLIKKKTIAVNKILFAIKEASNFKGKCNMVDDKLLEKFNNLGEGKNIDITKITMYNKDTVIQYKEEFKKLPWRGFNKMDVYLNFSRIAFSDNYDKAIVIYVMHKERLNGISLLVYLEKENYVWKVKCKKTLSIS